MALATVQVYASQTCACSNRMSCEPENCILHQLGHQRNKHERRWQGGRGAFAGVLGPPHREFKNNLAVRRSFRPCLQYLARRTQVEQLSSTTRVPHVGFATLGPFRSVSRSSCHTHDGSPASRTQPCNPFPLRENVNERKIKHAWREHVARTIRRPLTISARC